MGGYRKDQYPAARQVSFPNGNRARLAVVPPGVEASSILGALGVPMPRGLIIALGGAAGLDQELIPRLGRLFSEGIARAAADAGALIIDGGTDAGVMALMGRGVAAQGRKVTLLGLSPAGKVTYPGGPVEGSIKGGAPLESNHSHFVLVECDDWGGETETMFELASFLGARSPSLAILANGGDRARNELLRNMADRRQIIVLAGSGRLADQVAAALGRGPSLDSRIPVTAPSDVSSESGPLAGLTGERDSGSEIAAIAQYDRLSLFDIQDGPEALAELIEEKLRR